MLGGHLDELYRICFQFVSPSLVILVKKVCRRVTTYTHSVYIVCLNNNPIMFKKANLCSNLAGIQTHIYIARLTFSVFDDFLERDDFVTYHTFFAILVIEILYHESFFFFTFPLFLFCSNQIVAYYAHILMFALKPEYVYRKDCDIVNNRQNRFCKSSYFNIKSILPF